MNSRTVMLRLTLVVVCLTILVLPTAARKKQSSKKAESYPTTPASPLNDIESKQFFSDPQTRETDPPNFVRLVVMRLIYGLAVQMGFEDRLSGVLNGIFVPPNAEDDDYGGGFGADIGDDLLDF